MSTLSGIASKGEKGKSKFQSLDINSLYRGESLEPHQAKSTLPRKHGMQSLGKVPSARRPPANLPSLKSEHGGNDPAISLVPTGGSGWGNKPGETGPPTTSTQPQQQQQQEASPVVAVPSPVATPQASVAAPIIALVAPTAVTPPVTIPGPSHPVPIQVQQPPHTQQQQHGGADKSWSSIMAGPGETGGVRPPSFLAHQSPQFQQEFPKLSSGDGQVPTTGQKGGSDTQYGPGPSLRPQTEGSWIQGGGRTGAGGSMPPASPPGAGPAQGPLLGPDPAGGRNSSAQSALQGAPMGPGGHPANMASGPIPHQFRGVVPQFMYTQRGNFPGGFPPNFAPGSMGHGPPRPRFPYPPDARFMRPLAPVVAEEASAPRPIIKEEELSKMDDIARDAGWATHDDIDYNQKLAFSDDEDSHKDEVRKESRQSSKEEKRSGDSEERDKRVQLDHRERSGPPQDHRERSMPPQDHRERSMPSQDHRERSMPPQDHRERSMPPQDPRERSGPPQDHRDINRSNVSDQRDRSGPVDPRDRIGPPPEQRGWQQQQQQGRPLPPVDFRGGPPHAGPPHAGPPHAGPPPVATMRAPPAQGARVVEDEEIWRERRRQQSEEVAIAVERAKQRKEEEEKRYEETRLAARQKLQQLEQKMGERARTSESKDDQPLLPTLPTTATTTIPLPEWEKEREIREKESRERDRSRTSSEGKEEKAARDARDAADFRQLTQTVPSERSTFNRGGGEAATRTERDREREMRGERGNDQPVFSRQFQSNLPPRFQKQQAERTSERTVRPSHGGAPAAAVQAFDPRWTGPSGGTPAHFPSGQLPTGNLTVKPGHLPPARRNSETERDREREPISDRLREREPISERPRDREAINERPRDREQVGEWSRDRRDRHTSDSHDNYRRDNRSNYTDARKPQGNYYEGSDYQRERPYNRDHDRGREESERHGRDWERDGSRQYSDRREGEKENYERHGEDHEPRRDLNRQESGGEWRENKEWKQPEERETKPDRRDREPPVDRRDERPQRPDSRDSRASKESRNSRDDVEPHKFQRSESWADSPFEPQYDVKEDKKKGGEYYRGDERGRHAPGPITREKLEAAELRGEQKRNLTQLRRGNGGPALIVSDRKQDPKQIDLQGDKKDRRPNEPSHAWHQNSQQKNAELGNTRPMESKSWADSLPEPEPLGEPNRGIRTSEPRDLISLSLVKPLLPVEDNPNLVEDKKQVAQQEAREDSNDTADKQKLERSKLEGISDARKEEGGNDFDDKQGDKSHGAQAGRGGRGNRQNWGSSYPVNRSWGAAPAVRGRRGGERSGPSSIRRPPSSRSQDWGHRSESEYSGDEVSASTESGKEDAGRAAALRVREGRSPKGVKKVEKDDRNRDMRREGDKGMQDARRYDKRGANYETGRGGRDGFAPRGEPSRRGRGGFRTRGSVSGRRMDGYGPPSSKSPFGGSQDEKPNLKDSNDIRKEDSSKEDLGGEIMNAEDKMKLKQQALSAGIIGSGARHLTQTGKMAPPQQVPPRMQRKSESERRDSSRSKARGIGSSRTGPRDGSGRPSSSRGSGTKTNSSDHGEENWETTSENSEQDDRDRASKSRSKAYPPRQREPQVNRRNVPNVNSRPGPMGPPSSSNPSRAPGAEKRNNNGYNSGRDRNPMMGNGRPTNRGLNAPKMPMKDGTIAIQRLDEIKILDPALVVQALADLSAQKKAARPDKDKTNQLDGLDLNNYASVVIVDDQPEVICEEERFTFDADNGFQEVRSKKNVKESRQKVEEASTQQKTAQAGSPGLKDRIKLKPLLQDGVAIARPQMAPRDLGLGGKPAFERPRQSKLPPRLAKQRENNRLQKQQQQQLGGIHNDINEMNSINQNISLFPNKDHGSAPPPVNAWDKPITGVLRANSPGANVGQAMQLGGLTNSESCNMDPNEQPHSGASSQRSTPNGEKKLSRETTDKSVLDGSTPPVQTIIFENTNYKTSPSDMAMKAKFGSHMKKGDGVEDGKTEAIQMPAMFNKEDGVDMKLDFTFDSELSQLTDDKKGLGLTRSMHAGQNLISPSTADLNFKIASVKKVWEEMPTVQEHAQGGDDVNVVSAAPASYTPAFGNVGMGLEQTFGKQGPDCQQGGDNTSHNPGEVVYSHHPHSPGPQMQVNPNSYGGGVVTSAGGVPSMVKNDPTSSNVCKVKPQQQAVMSGGVHQGPHSPPPFNAANQSQPGHINYQAALSGGGAQFGGISAIPSPPTVLYNSTPQMPTQGGLYGAFQIDQSQVLGGQARSQFSQFPPYGLSQGLGQTSAFNQQSMYLPTPHQPPSNAQDMYQSSISQYRIQAAQGPFGQSQQLGNSPSTVLISSSSNSLMSASVKPSSQQIGAIGTKGGVPYQTSSMPTTQQPSQMYIQYDPSQVMNQSYLSGSQLVQRSGPVQSNVVPSLQPSSSYYSGSAGQGAFYQAASSSLPPQQPPAPQQLQAGSPYGLQGYGNQAANGNLQSFSSQFLSSPLQMAPPYRNTGLPAPPTYMKTAVMSDHASNGRSQLKSPSNNPDQQVLQSVQSVFSAGVYPPQIPSPKSRNNMNKQQQQPLQQQQSQQQQSPTQQHHKFNSYQTVSANQSAQLAYQQGVRTQQQQMSMTNRGVVQGGMSQPPPRYPPPIQRPNVAYQQVSQQQQQQQQGGNMMGARHRQPATSRPPPSINKMQNYYSGHAGNLKMDSSSETKQESTTQQGSEAKMSEVSASTGSVTTSTNNSVQPAEHKMAADIGKDDSAPPATE